MSDDEKQPKVLIIEDNVNTQELFRTAFEDFGFKVLITEGAGGDFVSAVRSFQPDIISMDLMIGRPSWGEEDPDGFEAIEMLRNDDRTKDIPVIVMTNFFTEDKVEKARQLEVVDYINLQSQSVHTLPEIFLTYLSNPEGFQPTHPILRSYKNSHQG